MVEKLSIVKIKNMETREYPRLYLYKYTSWIDFPKGDCQRAPPSPAISTSKILNIVDIQQLLSELDRVFQV